MSLGKIEKELVWVFRTWNNHQARLQDGMGISQYVERKIEKYNDLG